MFESDSRYYNLATKTYFTAAGKEIPYVERRLLPRASALQARARVIVTEGERLDQISARTLDDPFKYWLICDANDALNPEALVEEPGAILTISVSF